MNHRIRFGHYLNVGDCVPWLEAMGEGIADLGFVDPPFNIGWEYDKYKDRRKPADYLAWCEQWGAAIVRVLRPGAALWLAIGDEYAAELVVMFKRLGLTLRNWCVWHYRFGQHLKPKFGRNKTHLVYFVKGKKPAFWDTTKVMIPSVRQEKGDKRANPAGRVPGDVWEFSRICGNFGERTDHPCQMPAAILERILLSTCRPNGLVIDPFCGSGTTHAAGIATGRFVDSCELSERYARKAIQRLTLNAKAI